MHEYDTTVSQSITAYLNSSLCPQMFLSCLPTCDSSYFPIYNRSRSIIIARDSVISINLFSLLRCHNTNNYKKVRIAIITQGIYLFYHDGTGRVKYYYAKILLGDYSFTIFTSFSRNTKYEGIPNVEFIRNFSGKRKVTMREITVF